MAELQPVTTPNIDGGAPDSVYTTAGGSFQMRRGTAATWTSVNPVLAAGEPGYEMDTGKLKIGDGVTTWGLLAYGGPTGASPTLVMENYGDGSDGNVTISSGSTVLARNMYYNNLTINGTGNINCQGFQIFVAGILDLSAAPAGAITANGGTGGTPATTTAGAAGTAPPDNTIGGGGVGVAGKAGGTVAGTVGTSSAVQTGNGAPGGAGGTGGTGSSGVGGAGGSVGTMTALPVRRWETSLLYGITLLRGGSGGSSGGSGGGDGTAGGGSGGSGAAGGIVQIFAKTINRGASTAVACIQANGGNGGGGGTPAAGNRGGGGGSGGGGGGWVFILYDALTGATATNALQAKGGTGGTGGNGVGTGTGGRGGTGGSGGRITLLKVSTSTGSETFGTTGTAGSANTGITGGAGGAGNNAAVSL